MELKDLYPDMLRKGFIEGEPHECWAWSKGLDGSGYSHISLKGKRYKIHRISYDYHKGGLRPDMVVMHSCDVRTCANPAHLTQGTQAENLADMRRKARNNDARAEKHSRHVLTDGQALELLRRRKGGETMAALARSYGISAAQVCRLIKGQRRPWLQELV